MNLTLVPNRLPISASRLTSTNIQPGLSAITQKGTGASSTIPSATPNPLADVANWKTGGRKAPFSSMGKDDLMMWYIGGAVLLAVVLMRRKK